jgi:hypothetical protein
MLRINTTQKQYELPQRNKQLSGFPLEDANADPVSFIKTMLKIIKIKSGDNMDRETKAQFSKITDAVVQMAEQVRK